MTQLPAPGFAAGYSNSPLVLVLLPMLQAAYALKFLLDRYLYNKGRNWGKFPVQISPSPKMGSEDLNLQGVNPKGMWSELLEGLLAWKSSKLYEMRLIFPCFRMILLITEFPAGLGRMPEARLAKIKGFS